MKKTAFLLLLLLLCTYVMVRSDRHYHVISKTLDLRESPSSSTKVLAQFSPYDHVALFYHAVDVGCYNAQVNGQKGGVDISVKKKLFFPMAYSEPG